MPDLICITVSTNYEDFLAVTLPQNYTFFTKWYIVTAESDTKTIELITNTKYASVVVPLFFDFHKGGAQFDKGGALLYGQTKAQEDGYINNCTLILDSDIFLPDNFLECISNVSFQEETLYGIVERRDYMCYNDFVRNQNYSIHSHSKHFQGCFQLYTSNTKKYQPSIHCGNCDYVFRDLFQTRIHLDIIVQHLGTDLTNWSGRNREVTKFFLTKQEEKALRNKVERIKQRVFERTGNMSERVRVGDKLYF